MVPLPLFARGFVTSCVGVLLLVSAIPVFPDDDKAPQRLRIACQAYGSESRTEPFDLVLVLEQLSTSPANPGALAADNVDGLDLLDHMGSVVKTDDVAFRMKGYRGVSLVSHERTVGDIVGELVDTPPSLGGGDQPIDYEGTGFRNRDTLEFEFSGPYGLPKDMKLRGLETSGSLFGVLNTDAGFLILNEDGYYRCARPFLIPGS